MWFPGESTPLPTRSQPGGSVESPLYSVHRLVCQTRGHFMHVLPRARPASTMPFSLATRAFSHSSSSLSRTRSYSHNSMVAVSSTTASREALNRTTGRGQCRDEGADLDEQQRRAGTYPNTDGAWLRETFILARQVDGGLASRQGLPP
jgi:hypothetical protein